jgi:hypothetical protein
LEPYIHSENGSRILIFSQRRLRNDIFRCADYEFEDTICSLDSVDIFAPVYNSNKRRNYLNILRKKIPITNRIVRQIDSGVSKFSIEKEYDLFYAHCIFANDLLALNSLKDWRKKCRIAVCYIAELWKKDLDYRKEAIHLLKQFDYILLTCGSTVDVFKDIAQRPCSYFPPGIDAIKFCPLPVKPHRCIDVLSMGRRSEVTHNSLIDLVEQGKIFYIHDTAKFNGVHDPAEHRSMLANLIKRSRFLLVYPAKVNVFDERGGQEVLGYRYFEGGAGGAVLLGSVPDCVYADGCFDWSNSLISLPYDADNIAEIIAEADAQPAKISSIRKNNIVTSLLQHDWAYRWREILNIVGMKPRPALEAREQRLRELAEAIKSHSKDII